MLFQGIGDMTLAYQAFRLALSNNNDHAEAYNNLGVLEMRKGHVDMVRYLSQSTILIDAQKWFCFENRLSN